jgi:quinol monooxygenase YgiN
VEIVVARYRAADGQGDAVAAALAKHVSETRAERGYVQFDANRGVDDRDAFVLYERYVDEAAFDEHRRSPHFQRNIEETVVPLLAERAWQRYQAVQPS